MDWNAESRNIVNAATKLAANNRLTDRQTDRQTDGPVAIAIE